MININPIVAKIIANFALKILSDEESRKRTFYIILYTAMGVLLLSCLIIYLIITPLYKFMFFLNADEFELIREFQYKYGFNQSFQLTDSNYLESIGQDYSGLTFTNGGTEVVYYNQADIRWGNEFYGADKIGTHACGPTSLAIVVSSLAERKIDPLQMSRWAFSNGYYCEGSGSYHSLIPNGAKHFGLKAEGITQKEPQKLINALSSGKLVVAIMGKGHFTSSGHFIVLRGVTSEGKILVADPISQRKSEMEWDINIILNEARKGAGAGGPFWAIYR